jgi:hypothetical protein
MAIAILASEVFDKPSGGATAFTVTGFAVPAGTDCLVALVLFRNYATVAAPAVSADHNGDALTSAGATAGGGGNDINTAWLYRRNPDIGTFDVDLAFASQVRGCAVWLLALSGVKASGSPFGATPDSQTTAPTATDTVSLGLTPAATADSLLLAALGICPYATTLTTWTGGSFSEEATGQYTANGLLTATFRYRNAAPATAQTVSAKFGASDTNIGGALLEVLAELASVDVTGAVSLNFSVAGGIAGPASAGLADATFLSGATAWTDLLLLQADDVAVDRRIISAGPPGAATLTLDAVATGAAAANVFRWRARLADGVTQAETGAGTQSASARHLALVREPGRTDTYVDGEPSGSAAGGELLTGGLDVGPGPIEVGGHAAASPGPFTGLLGRWLRYGGVLSDSQIRLMARSLLAPERLWGIGAEDDAQVPGQGPIAVPQDVLPDGRPSVTVNPTVIRPDGVAAPITAVTQPAHGTVAISGAGLQLNLERGWQGTDFFTFTVTGSGGKTSTARITIIQARPALLARGDVVTVAQNGTVTFNPRDNDIGAGPLRTIGVSAPANGTAQIQADGRIRYAPNTGYAGADAFSYTVADDWGSQTASVAVTVTASSFVSASADAADTDQGVAVDLAVLDNDTASPALLPLVVKAGSITAPSPSGSATLLSDNRTIRYSPVSGFTGEATFNYTARSAAVALPESSALVRVSVIAPAAALPKAAPEVPAAKQRTVGFDGPPGSTRYDTREAAYAAAAAGDHIILADGTYAGDWSLNRVFSNSSPVVIRSRNVANGKEPLSILSGQVSVNGAGHWLYNLRFTRTTQGEGNSAVRVSSHHVRVTRNWFNTPNGLTFVEGAECHDNWCGWNRFASTRTGAGVDGRANFVRVSLNGPLASPTQKMYNIKIYRNYFKDNGTPATNDDDSCIVYIGNAKASGGSAGYLSGTEISYNYCAPGETGHQRCMYLKRGCDLMFNDIRSGGLFGFRHGSVIAGPDQSSTDATGRMWGNRVDNDSYIILSGAGSDVRGNVVTNPGGIRGLSGNRNGSGAAVAGLYQACSNLLLVGNEVDNTGAPPPYNIGYHDPGDILDASQGGKVNDVYIFGHSGKTPISVSGTNRVVFDADHVVSSSVTISDLLGGYDVPSTITLSETQVGFEVTGQGP